MPPSSSRPGCSRRRGLLDHPRVGEGGEDHLRGRVDRAALALLAVLGRQPGAPRLASSQAVVEQLLDLGVARPRALGRASAPPRPSSAPLAAAAAKSSGASSFSAVAYQNSASCRPPRPGARRAASQWATRIAPRQLPQPDSGVARDVLHSGHLGRVEDHHLAESPGGARAVVSSRSLLIEVASTGPCHSSSAGIARPVVLRPRSVRRRRLAPGASSARSVLSAGATRPAAPGWRPSDQPARACGARATTAGRRAGRACARQRAPRSRPCAGCAGAQPPCGESLASRAGATAEDASTAPSEPPAESGRAPPQPDRRAAASARARAALDHPRVGVDQLALDRREPVLDEEGAPPDHPERLAAPQRREQLGLGRAQAEQLAQPLELVGRLGVDHLACRRRRSAPRRSAPRASPPRPAAPRSERRCRTMMFCTPLRAAELEGLLQPLGDADVAGDPPALLDDEIIFGAVAPPASAARFRSSTIACMPGGGAGHQDPERGGVLHRARGRGRPAARRGRGPRVVGPSNIPRRSPSQRRCRASATWRGWRRRSPRRSSAETPATIASRGWSSASTTMRQGRLAGSALARRPSSATRSPASSSGPSSRRSAAWRDRAQQARAAPRGPPRGLSGLSRTSPPGASAIGRAAERPRQRRVLALGVEHPGLAAEDALAEEVGLDQGATCAQPMPPSTSMFGPEQDAARVERPGVIEPGAAVGVAADVDAGGAEAALGEERVGGLEVGGRGRVAGALAAAPARLIRSPRQSGRVKVKAGVLLAVEALQLEARELRGVLDLGRGALELRRAGRRDRDVAGEAHLGVAVGQLLLAPRGRLLAAPDPRRRHEALALALHLLGDLGGLRRLGPAHRHRVGDRLDRHRDRAQRASSASAAAPGTSGRRRCAARRRSSRSREAPSRCGRSTSSSRRRAAPSAPGRRPRARARRAPRGRGPGGRRGRRRRGSPPRTGAGAAGRRRVTSAIASRSARLSASRSSSSQAASSPPPRRRSSRAPRRSSICSASRTSCSWVAGAADSISSM